MICKKCGNLIKASDEVCGKCGEKIDPESFKKGNFSVRIPQKELKREKLDHDFVKETAILQRIREEDEFLKIIEAAQENEALQESEAAEDHESAQEIEYTQENDETVEENTPTSGHEMNEENEPEEKGHTVIVLERPEEEVTEAKQDSQEPKTVSKKSAHAISKARIKEEKKIKKSYITLKVICCLCAVVTVALSCVGIFTDYLKTDLTATKTVALSRLSDSDKQSFEEYIIKFSSIYGKDIDCSQMSIYDLLEMLDPGNANGLYSGFFEKATVITKKADPAVRFADSESSFRYCKIKADDIETIASSFGIRLINAANTSDCYYYSQDGYYYFAAEKGKTNKNDVTVSVSDSKRTEDGSYYIECDVQNGNCEKIYCLVNMEKEDGSTDWKLLKLSDEALFADDGTQISTRTEGSIPYEMNYTKITAETADGVTYAEYEISYPIFDAVNGTDEENKTATTLNLFYSDLIKAYQDKADEADKNYQDYAKRGYVDSLLPGTVKYISSVQYNRNGYISLLDEISEYSPTDVSKAAKKVVTDAAKQGIEKNIEDEVVVPVFPTFTYSGYTVNIETSEFVKKDEIFGKDYLPLQENLFKIYMGYDADAEISLKDENGIGRSIYSSTWVLSEEGVGFCYQNPMLYKEFIVLPYQYIDPEF